MPRLCVHSGDLVPPIESLQKYFRNGGVSIIQAAFAHTFFVHPDAVRDNTPLFRDRVRRSREHYPGLDKGKRSTWSGGDGRPVILDDNSRAQTAWEKYTGTKLARGTGYGVRHIWGNTHNPDAFTAGWNICYMPFWAGMLTEDQHPLEELQQAIRQASWDLYFAENPVCTPPAFVEDPGLDLNDVLKDGCLLIRAKGTAAKPARRSRSNGDATRLPITLVPTDSREFLDSLLQTAEAWIEVTYADGHREVGRWDAKNMRRTSNVPGNLRSRRQFRAGNWQREGIVSVQASIEHPDNLNR